MLPRRLFQEFSEEMKTAALPGGAAEFATRNAVPLALGTGAALAGGLSLYDKYKGRKRNEHWETVEEALYDSPHHVDSKAYMAEKDPSVKVVATVEDIDALAQDEILERSDIAPAYQSLDEKGKRRMKREIVTSFVNNAIVPGSNAAALRGQKGDYIIAPSRLHPALLEHELGHIKDYRERGFRMSPEDDAKNPYEKRKLLQALWKPSFRRGQLKSEEAAWDQADPTSPELKRMREAALGTYETAFHQNRARVTGALAKGLGLATLMTAKSRLRGG